MYTVGIVAASTTLVVAIKAGTIESTMIRDTMIRQVRLNLLFINLSPFVF